MSEIKYGIGKASMRSQDAVEAICRLADESFIPEAENMNNNKMLYAAQALSDIACGIAYGGTVDREQLRNHAQKMVSSQPLNSKLHLPELTRVCGIIENELVPHTLAPFSVIQQGRSNVDIGELKRASGHLPTKGKKNTLWQRDLKVGVTTETEGGEEAGRKTSKTVDAGFIDKVLQCSVSALSKLSCEAAANPESVPDVRDEAACLVQFANRIRSYDFGGKTTATTGHREEY